MRDMSDETVRRLARQLRVGVERNHVANFSEHLALRGRDAEARLDRAATQSIEHFELAALALPADPLPLALVPLATTMKQMKARRLPLNSILPAPAIARVQLFYAGERRLKQDGILRHLFGGRVRIVSEQGEVELC